jgi:hypothetical protein
MVLAPFVELVARLETGVLSQLQRKSWVAAPSTAMTHGRQAPDAKRQAGVHLPAGVNAL